jgi:dihydrodipicolinate synthase/N-acetylneuraminate lyase
MQLSLRTGVPHLLQRLVPHTAVTAVAVTVGSKQGDASLQQQQQQQQLLLCAARAAGVFAGLTVGVVHTSARSAAEWAAILKKMGATGH